ncbi:endonuclease III [Candidatus Roizmanbacteria bacterium]|nr:endonuclease III [Candidatus Roizmanbacteria bacterium]
MQRITRIISTLKTLFPNPNCTLNFSNPWEALIAVMLSAQTTDKAVNKVTPALFKAFPTPQRMARAQVEAVEPYIHSLGFYHIKSQHLIQTAQIISTLFRGQVPSSLVDLQTLPGVGRKTANVVMGVAFGIPTGIAVDTHVKRLARLLALTQHTDPDKIEEDLEKIVPKTEWIDFSHRLIEYGRTYCPARSHSHENCPLSNLTE